MEKRTLKFPCLIHMAKFSKAITEGYLMNTNNLTLTGKFSSEEIERAQQSYEAVVIQTSDKVFSYENP